MVQLGDHGVQTVAAQQQAVAGAQLDLAAVDLDERFGAERAAQDAALRVRQGGLAGEVALAHHLADQRVVVGDLLEGLVAPQVKAAVADVGELEAVVVEQGGGEGGAHAGARPVGARFAVDAFVGDLRGVGQRGAVGEVGGQRVERQVRGDLAGLGAAHAVGHGHQGQLVDEGVFVARPVKTDVGQRRVADDEGHATVTPRSGRSSRRYALRCRA